MQQQNKCDAEHCAPTDPIMDGVHHVGPGLLGRCLCDLNKQNNVITQL
jgi:hypothetical protein